MQSETHPFPKSISVFFSLLFLALITTLLTPKTMAAEEPQYTVIETAQGEHGTFELRAYAPMIIAETVVAGSMDDASSQGFRRIADYIFGNNTLASGDSTKIAMTAPVTMEPQSARIDMTAPVTLEKNEEDWRIHFVMPSEYSLQTLPKPNNSDVTLREVPQRQYAVVRFSGLVNETMVAEKTHALLAWIEQKNIQTTGQPELARYNPPWTLPGLRRNEIMVAY